MMENFAANCTPPQDGEKIFETLRDWSENEYQEEMAFLGIDDSNMSWERKKILVILYMLSGVKDKEGWFYIDNANLSEICEVGERTITRVKRDFERLGIIKIKRGYQGSPTRYKFFEKKLNKLPKISKKTPESTLAALAGKNVIPANKNKVYKSVIGSLLSSCVQVPAKVDSKKFGKEIVLEGGVQYKDKEEYKDKNQDIEQYKEGYEEGLMIGKIDNNIIKELVEVLFDKLDKISTSIDNSTRVNSEANTKVIESINTMVQAMVNTKDETIEELKKISTSIENTSKSNGIVQPSIDSKVIEEKDKTIEELQGKINKLQEDYSKVIEERNYFKKRFNDSEEFFKKVKAYIPSEFLGNSKNRKESSSKSNVGMVQESYLFDSERTYNLKRLKYEIVEPYQRMIININDSEKLAKAREDSFNDLIKFLNVHRDVLDKYDIEDSMNEILKVVSMKERELAQKANTNEASSKSNDIVQSSSIDSSSDSNLQRILANQMAEATAHPTSSKRNEETKATTTSKQEQCHFPTLRENQLNKLKSFMETFKERISKATDKETLEAIEADFQEDGINFFNLNKEITTEDVTPYSEEISKAFQAKEKELAPKVDTKTATKATVQEPSKQEVTVTPKVDIKKLQEETARKLEEFQSSKPSTPKEVEIPKVEQIALRDEEQKQLQELKDNEIIKPLLENFTNVRFTDQGAFDKIVMEVRKAVTSGNYNQKVVQAFLDFSYTTYTFDCNLKDVLKPIEASKQEVTETPKEETKVEEPKQEETVTPSEESRDEDYWNPAFTDEQAQETLSRLPKANSRYEKDEDEDQGEVIDDDMPSDKEVAAVVGGYDEENDEIF